MAEIVSFETLMNEKKNNTTTPTEKRSGKKQRHEHTSKQNTPGT
jgi:hypothetical protein